MPTSKKAFTLIELSIVLVIIGLVVGGVFVGQDLIKGALYRKLIKQKEEFATAVSTFKGKYNCLPGDCAKAYSFFGATCGNNTVDEEVGCNGDGNDVVEIYAPTITGENVKFWSHLVLAGYIQGSFTGRDYDPGTHVAATDPRLQIGVNVPAAAINGLGWAATQCPDAVASDGSILSADIRVFCLGSDVGGGQSLDQGAMTYELAFTIDNKFDDGLPRTGLIRGDSSSDCGADTYQTVGVTSAAWKNNTDCSLTFLY